MQASEPKTPVAVFVVAFAMVFAGCTSQSTTVDAKFDMPTGLAIAGTEQSRLFVVNTGQDAIQVIDLGDGLNTLNPVEGPSYYFPLRIPGGPAPEEVAASENGRFVAVLNWVTQKLQLIDADSLRVATYDGVPLEIALGPSSAKPYRVISVPQACGSEEKCAGVFVVSLPGTDALAEVIIREELLGPVAEVRSVYALPGKPGELTVAPSGKFVYAADTSQPQVYRVELGSGFTDSWDTGVTPGVMAVSTNERFLVVARPETDDLIIFDGAVAANMQRIAANPAFAPSPECIPNCDSEEAASEFCPGAHPADLSLCRGPSGLETALSGEYTGVYTGFRIGGLSALGAGANHPPMEVPCESIGDEPLTQAWEEVVVVLSENGGGVFLGLQEMGASDSVPTLLSRGFCNAASLSDDYDTLAAPYLLGNLTPPAPARYEDVFDACVPVPNGLNRFTCAEFEDTDAGMVLSPMRTGFRRVRFQWEPPVQLGDTVGDDLERTTGGGTYQVRDEGALFGDVAVNFGSYTDFIQTKESLVELGKCVETSDYCGDILEIISELPAPNPEDDTFERCQAELEAEVFANCALERRILDMVTVDNATHLVLDRPLPESCIPESGRIAYRVRVGDAFGVVVDAQEQLRLSPGEALGVGGTVGTTNALAARIRDGDFGLHERSACERYGESGSFIGTRYNRGATGQVKIQDAHYAVYDSGTTGQRVVPLEWSLLRDTTGYSPWRAGLPTLLRGTSLWSRSGGNPVLFMSYARSNKLVGFVPYDYIAESGEAGDDDAPFLSSDWFDSPSHFLELN